MINKSLTLRLVSQIDPRLTAQEILVRVPENKLRFLLMYDTKSSVPECYNQH